MWNFSFVSFVILSVVWRGNNIKHRLIRRFANMVQFREFILGNAASFLGETCGCQENCFNVATVAQIWRKILLMLAYNCSKDFVAIIVQTKHSWIFSQPQNQTTALCCQQLAHLQMQQRSTSRLVSAEAGWPDALKGLMLLSVVSNI